MSNNIKKPYQANLVLQSELYNLSSITTDATIENKFQICLTKLNDISTRKIALNDIRNLISQNVSNPKSLRHFISALKITNKSNHLSHNAIESQASIYGILSEEYKQQLYDPLDKPPNLIKTIARLLSQLREGYLSINNQIQNAVAESYLKILIYSMPKDDIPLIIIVFFEPLINTISSGVNLIIQQGAALVLCKLIEYIGGGMVHNLNSNLLEIVADKAINNLLKGTITDNEYVIESLYQLLLNVKFDIFIDKLKELYVKLISCLQIKEFSYQFKISVLKVFSLIADNLLNMDNKEREKIIGYFQQDIIKILNDKTSDRIHKVQLKAREALNKWKELENI